MAIQTSFPKVADQIIAYNKNVVEVLDKISQLATSTESSISVNVYDQNGAVKTYTIPTNSGLKADIDRLDANIKSLYSIDTNGALIQTTKNNAFKKVITVDLNREPLNISSLDSVTKFKTTPNWFFDSLLDPMISIEFDLSGKIENNVRKCLSRRYIVDFAKDENGNLTTLGQSALNSFNTNFKGSPSVVITDFEDWHKTTPGVVEPLNPRFDEQIFDLQPNSLKYDGLFSVLGENLDTVNNKLWYVLNTLDYIESETKNLKQLSIGDEIIVNSFELSSTKYKVIEVSTSQSNPRIRVERVEGYEPIFPGVGTLKIYSSVVYTKKVMISVGYNERNVIFLKPINTENNLVAKKWSLGTGFFSSELTLDSNSDANGLSMDQFYMDYIYDYGEVLKDLVAKKTPNKLAGTPNAPTLTPDNFKVVQINQHLTDTPDSNLIKQKHNFQVNLRSEIEQLQTALDDRNKKLKISKFKSDSDKKKSNLELLDISLKRESKSKLLASITREIIDLSKDPKTKIDPKFRVRGFWAMPESVSTRGTKPQEVVQFIVQYRYLSKDGKEAPVESYSLNGQQSKAIFSNWTEMKTDARKRTFDPATGEYFWKIEDLESADTPNINQLDLSIQVNEKVEVRVKSISEVGWPDSPVESDWSDILTIEFPDDLNNVLNENDFILKEATKEDLRVSMSNELSARGLDSHLQDQITVNGVSYHHDSNKILSGFKGDGGSSLNLYEYLKILEDRVRSLEDKINRAKGELQIVILRNNQEFNISNGSETVFNIECEDYLESYSASGVPTGRVYQNNIYVIKDFVIKVKNIATGSPLGLLSNRNYLQNSSVYNQTVPQTFWINDKDELLTSDITGATKTQINNQFLWQVNYDSVSDASVTKLTENIGNAFSTDLSNSITSVLSSNEFNIGYNETTILNLLSNNKSLLEPSKWMDKAVSVASTTKLLTTIHPVVQDLEKITELNSEKVKSVNPGENSDVIIPLNIYFKMNSLDTNQTGLNYQYINLNNSQKTSKHIKKVKFFLENESENRPFTFSIKFNINRNKVIMKKVAPAINVSVK